MDIVGVLERFADLSQTEQAWIMQTLLDFRQEQLSRFQSAYGAYANSLIDKLIKGA